MTVKFCKHLSCLQKPSDFIVRVKRCPYICCINHKRRAEIQDTKYIIKSDTNLYFIKLYQIVIPATYSITINCTLHLSKDQPEDGPTNWTIYHWVLKYGSLNLLELSGPLRVFNGIDLPFTPLQNRSDAALLYLTCFSLLIIHLQHKIIQNTD